MSPCSPASRTPSPTRSLQARGTDPGEMGEHPGEPEGQSENPVVAGVQSPTPRPLRAARLEVTIPPLCSHFPHVDDCEV